MYLKIAEGYEIYYEEYGQGYPVLFLPGILGDRLTFHPIIERLKSHYRCVTVEFAGQGRTIIDSRNLKENFSIDEHTQAICYLIKSLELSKVHIIGLSFGSIVAINFAHQYKQMVEKICLLGALLVNKTKRYENWNILWELCSNNLELLTRISIGLVYSENFLKKTPNLFGSTRERFAILTANQLQAFRWNIQHARSFDIQNPFDKIHSSILCIHGAEDFIHPIEELKGYLKNKKNVELLSISGVGHGLHVEAPDIIAKKIKEYL
jgi:pimeloyl-ACP methyl ester carboxylesterase